MDNQIKKAALDAQVKTFFEARKDVEVVYGTVDGNLFVKKRLNDAKNHAKTTGLDLFEFVRTESQEPRAKSQEPIGDGAEAGEKSEEAAPETTPKAKAAPKKAADKK